MVTNNSIVAEAILEDKLADIWPDYPCLYDMRCPEFKNRDLRNSVHEQYLHMPLVLGGVKPKIFHVFRLAALKRLRLRRSNKR